MSVDLVTQSVWERNVREKIDGLNLPHAAGDGWPITEMILPDHVSTSSVTSGSIRYATYSKGLAVVVFLMAGFANVEAYAVNPAAAKDAIDALRALHPRSKPAEDFIEICYWAAAATGPRATSRQISADHWETIRGNYSGDAQDRLDALMSDEFDPGSGGQLLLWAGPAGTGKTTALRSLAHEWRKWCTVQYIMDPERFFGEAAYLNAVILGDEWKPDPKKWRLLVLEDAGELLRKDAGLVTGKALMRLLNTVDGMIGQGLRIITLVTTNEKIEELHEAVARPGRCAQEIRFNHLSGDEASMWREAHNLPAQPRGSSLAELYAELKGFEGAQKKAPMGFAA